MKNECNFKAEFQGGSLTYGGKVDVNLKSLKMTAAIYYLVKTVPFYSTQKIAIK